MPYCSNCGTEIVQGGAYCPNCGAPVQMPGAQQAGQMGGQPAQTPAGAPHRPVPNQVPQTPQTQPKGHGNLIALIAALVALVVIVILIMPSLGKCTRTPVAPSTSGVSSASQSPQVPAASSSSATVGGGAVQPKRLAPQGYRASSTLVEEGYDHDPRCVGDANLETAWVEGAPGYGIGEKLYLAVSKGTHITSVTVCPGLCKTRELFERNGAPMLMVVSSGPASVTIDLSDSANSYSLAFKGQQVWLSEDMVSDGEVCLTILSVREGSKYDDTCISEVYVDGYTDDDGATASSSAAVTPRVPSDSVLQGLIGLADTLYDTHAAYGKSNAVPASFKASDLSAHDMAMGLYRYQYFAADDPRIARGQMSNTAAKGDLKAIMGELFGSASSAAMSEFYGNFTERVSGDTCTMSATGDFGDAGSFSLEKPGQAETEGDNLVASGNVVEFSGGSGGYEPVGTYTVRFGAAPSDGGVYRFVGLDVEVEGASPAGSTAGSSAGSSKTADEMADAALSYYKKHGGDVTSNTYASAVQGENGGYTIQIYNDMPDHTATLEWYYVDEDGVGTDVLGKSVNLLE